jgi:phenylpropionate dioxygenase-like ring-hydroxylating dioxygenase large terminal subunit
MSSAAVGDGAPAQSAGFEIPREGEGGLFTQSWFPVCYSHEVAPGAVLGREFLDGRVVVLRDESGRAQVLSAYCAHLGVDLAHGSLHEGRLRCPFHHWEYAGDGRCVRTGRGDPPPPRARLFAFPTVERYGVILAFNGQETTWEVPTLSIPAHEAALYPAPARRVRCDPWTMLANTPDWQHFLLLHGFDFDVEHAHRTMEWHENGMRYTMRASVGGRDFEFTPTVNGTSVFHVDGRMGERRFGLMAPFGLPKPGECDIYTVVVLDRGDPDPGEMLGILGERFGSMVAEDFPLVDTAHFRPRNLTRADAALARFLRMVQAYPRAHPSRDAIR